MVVLSGPDGLGGPRTGMASARGPRAPSKIKGSGDGEGVGAPGDGAPVPAAEGPGAERSSAPDASKTSGIPSAATRGGCTSSEFAKASVLGSSSDGKAGRSGGRRGEVGL